MSEINTGLGRVGAAIGSDTVKNKNLDGGDKAKTESKAQNVEQTEIKANDKKEITSEGRAKGHISIIDEGFSPKHPPCVLPMPGPTERKIKEAIEKMLKAPKEAVEEIRNAKGNDRDNALLNFQEKIDHMDTFQLKTMRDYLVKEMASPTNKDDELLGKLLNRVNKELDSRNNGRIFFEDIKPINFEDIKPINKIHNLSDSIKGVGKAVSEGASEVVKSATKQINKLED
ncbi:MAG: hypothetical protein U0354_13125 [Candidatus Sericytochromatia bacterium]